MLGHLDQQRKNLQSTKHKEDDQETMHIPSPLEKGLKHMRCMPPPSATMNQLENYTLI